MPVPAPNLFPAVNILRCSHAVLNVTDLGRSRDFYGDILGMRLFEAGADRLHLTPFGAPDRLAIVLQTAATASVARLGLRAVDEADLARAKAHLVGKGFLARWVERPNQGRTLAFQDNQGIPVELHHKMTRRSDAPAAADHRSDRPLDVAWINLSASSVDESVAFYNDLGFRVTDYVEDTESRRLWSAAMARRSDGAGIAFSNGRGPTMHHLALRMATPLAIIDRLDLIAASRHGDRVEWGPGRHGPSGAMFVYLRDPDGHRIALVCPGHPPKDPDDPPVKWETDDPRRLTLWGPPAPESFCTEGSEFDGVAVADPDLPRRQDA